MNIEEDNESTIFVSIPSYRDPECPRTLQDLYKKARYPERIYSLVNQQNYPEDQSATNFPGSGRYQRNIRLYQVPANEAKGPIVARAQIEQNLYSKGEADYWLQVDSHMAFVKDWDVSMIQQHSMLPDPNHGAITTFPPDFRQTSRQVPRLSLPTFIGLHDFSKTRQFPQQQRYMFRSFPKAPRKSLFYSAGFVFGPGEMVEEVPYDINCNYLFLGEEISMNARLYTHGYDLFAPLTSLVYHLSSRAYRPTFWEQLHKKNAKANPKTRAERQMAEQLALQRLQNMLFFGENPGDGFGLGKKRTLQQFEDFIGVDLQNQVATPRSKLGIVENAPDEEWVEKYGVQREQWEIALRNLQPLVPPKNI